MEEQDMTREEEQLLFRAVGAILDGQIELMRHLGITARSNEYGWYDRSQNEIARECDQIGYE